MFFKKKQKTFYSSKNPGEKVSHVLKENINQLFPTVIITSSYHHIRVIYDED